MFSQTMGKKPFWSYLLKFGMPGIFRNFTISQKVSVHQIHRQNLSFFTLNSVCLLSLALYSPLLAESTDHLTFLIFSESIIHFNSKVLFDSLAIFFYFMNCALSNSVLDSVILKKHFYLFILCTAHMWRSQDKLQKSVHSLHYVGLKDQIFAIRLDGRFFYLLSHLIHLQSVLCGYIFIANINVLRFTSLFCTSCFAHFLFVFFSSQSNRLSLLHAG